MKIALHLHGHLRTFRECLPTLKNLFLAGFDVDCFIHTWDLLERTTPSWRQSDIKPDPVQRDDIDYLIELLAPKRISVETQIPGELGEEFMSISKSHESLRKSISLRIHSEYAYKEYALCLVTRPDIFIKKSINIDAIVSILQGCSNKTLLQASYVYPTKSIWMSDSFGGRDCLFFGSAQVVSSFATIGLDSSIYYKISSMERTGEVYFDNFLRDKGICSEIIKFSAPDAWEIKR